MPWRSPGTAGVLDACGIVYALRPSTLTLDWLHRLQPFGATGCGRRVARHDRRLKHRLEGRQLGGGGLVSPLSASEDGLLLALPVEASAAEVDQIGRQPRRLDHDARIQRCAPEASRQ